jgi:anti-sigma B factor antagonist
MATFHAEAITAGDCAVLRMTGAIDVFTAPKLRQQVIDLVDDGARHIVGDLRGVDFLDSTGLGILVGGLKRLRLRQGSLTLVTSGGRILELFDITGLSHAFALHRTVLDAISGDRHWQAALAGEGQRAEEWCRKHELP